MLTMIVENETGTFTDRMSMKEKEKKSNICTCIKM